MATNAWGSTGVYHACRWNQGESVTLRRFPAPQVSAGLPTGGAAVGAAADGGGAALHALAVELAADALAVRALNGRRTFAVILVPNFAFRGTFFLNIAAGRVK